VADFGEDDDTVIELDPSEFDTPLTMPRCVVCQRVVFLDGFTAAGSAVGSGLFSEDRCVRVADGHWRWCCETREFVYKVPR